MLSIIHSTIKEPTEYFYILANQWEHAELIIIDSQWSEERKKMLQQVPNHFKRIVYAPPKERKQKMSYDFLNAHNTGLAYAEEDFCMCMGGENELCPDFYDRFVEDIDNFGTTDAFRPIDLEASQGDTKWNSYVKFTQRYFLLPFQPLGADGLRSQIRVQTCGFLILDRDFWYLANGFDERYDVGGHWYDNDLLTRLYNYGYVHIIIDQKLMVYRYPHISAFSPSHSEECKKIYDESKKFKYFRATQNNFSLDELHEEMLVKKQEYII